MTRNVNRKHEIEVHAALEKCQFVEETLRVYINLTIEIAKIEMASFFPVRITTADLSKLSLGKLVGIYSRLSDNASLKSFLNNITTERNYVAHRSLLFTIGELQDAKHMRQSLQKMIDIKERAKKAHEELLEETWRLRRALSALKRKSKTKP